MVKALALAAAAGGVLSGCAASPVAAAAQASSAAQPNPSAGITMTRDITDRFPGATLLGEAEFAGAVAGRRFRNREVGSDIVVERPIEVFAEGGQYRNHGLRTVSYGSYSIERGIVSIACGDCRYPFLGLSWERIFFRHQGKLLMAAVNGTGSVVELIPEPPIPDGLDRRPLGTSALRALLSDVYVTLVQPAGVIVSHPWGEIFRADGSYVQIPSRVRLFGRFEIRGNRVCVEGDGFVRLCRRVIPSGRGTYSFVNSSDGSTMLMTVTPHR
jgi:hypothetical protein